jgi:hypothetical protein
MVRRTLLPALALTALALSGCGGGSATAPSASAPASAASAGSAAAPSSAAGTPEATPSASTAAAGITDPCSVLSPSEMKKLTGTAITKGAPSDAGGTKLCIWTTKDPSSRSTVNFTGQEGPSQGASLSTAEGALKKQYGGTVSKITIKGADEARYVTGKVSKIPVVDIIAIRGDVYYQVLAASPTGADQYKGAVTSVVEALIAG